MKKFDRLPPEQRKKEIKTAAVRLFIEKGFAATTMENIVAQVSLSKGGVYRIYPSATAILSDLMIDGMHLRNAFYAEKITQEIQSGRHITTSFLTDMICDSLLLYPELSSLYVEFLWEKQRNPVLETLYREIVSTALQETHDLIQTYSTKELLETETISLERLGDLMNVAILGIKVLGLQDSFEKNKHKISAFMANALSIL